MTNVARFLFSVIIFVFVSCQSIGQPIHEGQKAPDILLPNAKGDSILLSGTLKNNKYVLIDFWASWCGPCRRTVPGLKKLYNKYHGKGLEIYSISLDENASAWKKAIFEDGTNWLHVIDKQGNIANIWGVSFIPNTFLLDEKQNVIAVNAEPDELDKFLKDKLK